LNESRPAKEGTEALDLHSNNGVRIPFMSSSEQYRRFAQECLEMACLATDERRRAIFLQMAQVWFRLAEDRENTANERSN
jgi:hypothetical protein